MCFNPTKIRMVLCGGIRLHSKPTAYHECTAPPNLVHMLPEPHFATPAHDPSDRRNGRPWPLQAGSGSRFPL